MKKFTGGVLLALILSSLSAHAGVNRILDGTAITVGSPSNVLTLPQTTDTVVGRATTDTLTNKSISGSTNTLSSIPVSAIATGTGLSVQSGGTGDATLTAHNVLLGEGTSAVAFAAPTQYQALIGNASGDPSFQALALNQSSAVSGQLAVGNGGTGAASLTQYGVLMGNGTSAVTTIGPSSNTGYVLTSNGASAAPTFQAPVSGAPSLNGGSGAPQQVQAATGITLASIMYYNFVWVVGYNGSIDAPQTVTATPSITAGTADGQILHVIGTSATNTVTLQDNAGLAGSNLQLNGTWVGGLYSQLDLHWDNTLGYWVEDNRR
jgi:hypothetical protein